MQNSSTPVELLYLGALGGAIGIVSAIFNWVLIWRNRRRVLLRLVTAERYYQKWTQSDFDSVAYGTMPPGDGPVPRLNSRRRALTILEFSIKNEYPSEITVGRIAIDGWMFSDHYTPGMYAPIRDYRVFDLYSGEQISLATYKKIPPKGTCALRVEIIDDTEGPRWHSSKSRYELNMPDVCSIEFRSDVGVHRARMRINPVEVYGTLSQVHHWSDLLPPAQPDTSGAPRPQGVKHPIYVQPKWVRIRGWYSGQINRLIPIRSDDAVK